MTAVEKEAKKAKKRALRESKELLRLERNRAKPKGPWYIYYMLFIVCIIYIADEVTSQIGSQMQSVLAQEIFAPIYGADEALAKKSAFAMFSIIGGALAMLYKPLSDRFGRKLFLVVNTLGMALGLVLTGIATNIPVYLLGGIVIAFFTPHDMQAVYILEAAPRKHRAKIYSVVKAVATLGVTLIPMLRRLLMPEGNNGWRSVYLVCAAFGAVAALVALFAIRESDAFLDERIAYLKMSEEERKVLKSKKDGSGAQGGFFSAVKLCLKNKQLRYLFIAYGFTMWAQIITMYYESTMSNGYAKPFLEQGMELSAALESASPFVTKALLLFPLGSALFQLAQGFFADKWGRRPAAVTMALCSLTSYVLFFVGASQNWIPYLVGFLCGSAVGSYWAAGDIVGAIMPAESAPTNLRASVLTAFPICGVVIGAVGLLTGVALLNIFGDAMVGYISLGIAVLGLSVSFFLLVTRVHDTKNVDIENVFGDTENTDEE